MQVIRLSMYIDGDTSIHYDKDCAFDDALSADDNARNALSTLHDDVKNGSTVAVTLVEGLGNELPTFINYSHVKTVSLKSAAVYKMR